MTTFDSWEVGICPYGDYLMHWGIPGMKHGRRRYQNEDGTWTSVGLAERRKREGFGEGKKMAKAQKKVAKIEKRQARKAARMEARQVRAEKKRLKSLKGLTDEELQKKINRVKMEQEYKELTRSPLVKSGERLVSTIMDYKANKEQRILDLNRQKIDMMRTKADIIKAKEGTKRASAEAKKAGEEAKQARYENRGFAARRKAKATLLDSKREYKNYTVRGGIARRINMKLTSGKAKEYESIRKAYGDTEANRIRSDAARDLKNRQAKQARQDTAAANKQAAREKAQRKRERERKAAEKQKQHERKVATEKKRTEKLRKERERARKEYEKRMRRITNF